MGMFQFGWISAFFGDLLRVSVLCGMGILLIFLISPLFGKRHTVFWRYALWIGLALRLILPFDLSIPGRAIFVPIFSGLESHRETDVSEGVGENLRIPLERLEDTVKEEPVLGEEEHSPISDTFIEPEPVKPGKDSSGFTEKSDRDLNFAPKESTGRSAEQRWSFLSAGAVLLWAVVCAALVFWHILCYFAFCIKVNKTKIFLTEKYEKRFVRTPFGNGRRVILVYTSSAVSSPVLRGIIKPEILLPCTGCDKEQVDFILEHELTHYRRKDLWVKFLLAIAKTMHWFNPFVFFMERQAAKDMEFLCDSRVVRNLTREEKKKYGNALLAYAAKRHSHSVLCTSEFSGDSKTLKERFDNIFSDRKKKRGILAALFGAAVLLSVSLFVSFTSSGESFESKSETALENETGAEKSTDRMKEKTDLLKETETKLLGLTMEKAVASPYGAVSPKLVYASEERAILYDYWGLLIYNIQKQRIEQLLDLPAAGFGSIQGDRAAHVEVSKDGSQILLYNESDTKERFLYRIDEKKLEYSEMLSFGEHGYQGLVDKRENGYALIRPGKAAYLSRDSLDTEEVEDREIFHLDDMEGLSLVISDNDVDIPEIYPLFQELFERQGETAVKSFHWNHLRKIIGKKYLHEDKDGWNYYIEEDQNRESPIWEFAEVLEPLLLTRYRDGERQVLEYLMYQGMWQTSPVLFTNERIVYKAAAAPDIMGVKDPTMVSIALDGSDRKTANDIPYHVIEGMCEDDGWIYYTGWSSGDTFSKPLCRIAADFSGGAQFVEDIPGYLCGVKDHCVYYLAAEEKEYSGIWKQNLATGEEEIWDKWGAFAEQIESFDVREREYAKGELIDSKVSGCRILYRYQDNPEWRSADIYFAAYYE